jgi:FlgD Ig-like domain/Matrixin
MNRNRFRFAVAVILCGALAFGLANPASAFVHLARQATPTSPVVQAHWFPSELPLSSAINPKNNDKSNAVALASVQAAAEAWEDIPTSFFSVDPHEAGPTDSIPALAFNNANSVFFDSAGVNFPTAGVIAFVRSIIDGSNGHTLDADMVFNDRDFWWSVTSPGLEPAPAGQSSVDLQSVACHEYGHYFSLDHTSVLGSTMIPFIQNNTTQRTLELDDRQGNAKVYPEANFTTDFGTVSGTVTNGFNGTAIFGAHVEAILISAPTPANSISNLSGELTLRNGQGEWTLYGLPPGDYAIRIVPLDGVQTTASDANIGGPYNGLDIDFDVEFWNGANEGADGNTDISSDFTPVTVTAGGAVTGINIQTNTFAGRVTIAQYGQFENVVGFTSNANLAVRFDPPFDAAYTIQNITFPSFTFNGIPAPFTSARLCVLNQATGLPDLTAPLLNITPFNGNPNGVNTVPVNLAGTPGQTYFWVLGFPNQLTTPGFPNNFPFVRMDFVSLERGQYLNSYVVQNAGPAGSGIILDRNFTVSMQCQADPSEVGIAATANTGGNRKSDHTEFVYAKPGNIRMDKFPMPSNSLDGVELVSRAVGAPGTWSVAASAGAGAKSIKLSPGAPLTPPVIYAIRNLDKNGNRSLTSNVVYTGVAEGADEPNGGAKTEATPVTLPVVNRAEAIGNAGDQDYFTFTAAPGSQLTLTANHVGTLDGRNDPDLVMFLYDKTGEIVAFNDDFTGLNPRVVYDVPPAPGQGQGPQDPRQFSVQVGSFNGSLLDPAGSPRVSTPATYRFDASATIPAAAASFARGLDPEKFHFFNAGPNPANPVVKLLYIIPRSAGSQSVRLQIFDVSGRLVRTLANGPQNPGPYPVVWDGRDDSGRGVGSGNYFARLSVGSVYREDSKITLLK